jgi:glycosyltransferase involved in cell wall biosynthesis
MANQMTSNKASGTGPYLLSGMKVLCLIESKMYQYDNRVRAQMAALRDAGAMPIVISPRERGDPFYAVMDGVHVYRYRKPSLPSAFGHLIEYAITMLMQSLIAVLVLFRHGFDVIEVTNPPDILWMVAIPYRLLGKRIIFDFQDPVPELFSVRYGEHRKLLGRTVVAMERMSLKTCDHVIANNQTSRRNAMLRGARHASDITIVRNGPDLAKDFQDVVPDPATRSLGRIVIGYLGMMNPQDQLENFMEMARIIHYEYGMRDVAFVMIGSGDAFDALREMRDRFGLTDVITMTGRLPWSDVLSTLAATDICVQPDLPTAYTKAITMCKLLEFMALGKAVVAFDLPETRVSGGDAVLYADGYTTKALASAVRGLITNAEMRESLGRAARRRVEDKLAWEHQVDAFLSVFDRVRSGQHPLSSHVQ